MRGHRRARPARRRRRGWPRGSRRACRGRAAPAGPRRRRSGGTCPRGPPRPRAQQPRRCGPSGRSAGGTRCRQRSQSPIWPSAPLAAERVEPLEGAREQAQVALRAPLRGQARGHRLDGEPEVDDVLELAQALLQLRRAARAGRAARCRRPSRAGSRRRPRPPAPAPPRAPWCATRRAAGRGRAPAAACRRAGSARGGSSAAAAPARARSAGTAGDRSEGHGVIDATRRARLDRIGSKVYSLAHDGRLRLPRRACRCARRPGRRALRRAARELRASTATSATARRGCIEHHFSDYYPCPAPTLYMAHLMARFPDLALGTCVHRHALVRPAAARGRARDAQQHDRAEAVHRARPRHRALRVRRLPRRHDRGARPLPGDVGDPRPRHVAASRSRTRASTSRSRSPCASARPRCASASTSSARSARRRRPR